MWLRKIICFFFGHRVPYVAKFTADICGGCSKVMFDHTPKYNARILALKKKSARIKKTGL